MYHQKIFMDKVLRNRSPILVLHMSCWCPRCRRLCSYCCHHLVFKRRKDRTAFGVPDWSTYLSDANNLPETIDTSDSETESIDSVIEE